MARCIVSCCILWGGRQVTLCAKESVPLCSHCLFVMASQEVLVLKLLCVSGQFCTVVVTIVARIGLRVKRGSFV